MTTHETRQQLHLTEKGYGATREQRKIPAFARYRFESFLTAKFRRISSGKTAGKNCRDFCD